MEKLSKTIENQLKDIIYISSIKWDFSWHRQQEMVTKMSEKGFKILYVEPSNKSLNKWNLRKKTDKIWVLTPPGLPYERCLYSINFFNAKKSRKIILESIKKIGMEDPIIWMDRIHGFDIKYFLRKYQYSIYDLVDEITAFGRYKNIRMLIKMENLVLNKVDLLISSSSMLLERKLKQSDRNGKNLFIPNGVDVKRFMECERIWENNRFEDFSKKIGFIGDISKRRIDIELVKTLAKRHPEWAFIFVGPGNEETKKILKNKNVFVYDAVSGEKIPEIVKLFDVGIIPYRHDKLDMDYVFPRKACEYLASGKPVVGTDLWELRYMKPYVLTASSVKEFEEAIVKSQNIQEDVEKMRQFAARFDWDYLIDEILNIIYKWE